MRLLRLIVTGLALMAAPGAAMAAPTLTLRPAFEPNPTQIRGRTQVRTHSLRRVFHTKSNCTGWVAARPDAVVNLPKGLGRVTMRFTGMGRVHIALPGNRYICGRGKITMNPWPAGRLEIRSSSYWGSRARVGPFTVAIEDPARPRSLGWKKTLKTVTLSPHLATPILVSGTTQPTGRIRSRRSSYCSNVQVPGQPVLMLKVNRPLTDIQYRVVSNGTARLVILGPLNRTNRNIPTACRSGQGKVGRLEPGTYAVKVGVATGYRGHARATRYTLVLRTPKTKLTPLAPVATIPGGLSVRDRMISRYYPQLPKGYWRSSAMLQSLFAVAPKQLFVFPTFDFDKASAKTIPWQSKNHVYPRKDEPLLLFANRWVMGADGSVFEVKRYSYLKARPSGAITLPRRPRNAFQRFGKALKNAGREDQRAIRSYRRAVKRESRCVDRVWSSANRRIRALRQRAWSRWRARRIQIIKDRTSSRAFRVCGTKRLRRTKKRLHERLMRTRTKRRKARLKKLRARMTQMFR